MHHSALLALGWLAAGVPAAFAQPCPPPFPPPLPTHSVTLLSACVAPFAAGDTPLQHYNAVLTLATALEVADGLLLLTNDDLARRCQVRARAAAAWGWGAATAFAKPTTTAAAGGGGSVYGALGGGWDGAATALAGQLRAALRPRWVNAGAGRAPIGRGSASAGGGAGAGGGDGGVEGRWATRDLNHAAASALAPWLAPVRLWNGGEGEGRRAGGVGGRDAATRDALVWSAADDDGAGDGDGRDGWIAASVMPSRVSAAGGGGGDVGGAAAGAAALAHVPLAATLAALTESLPAAAKVYDVRAASNAFPHWPSSGSGWASGKPVYGVDTAQSWFDVVDALTDTLPTWTNASGSGASGGGGPGKRVITPTAALLVRGVGGAELVQRAPATGHSTLTGRRPVGASSGGGGGGGMGSGAASPLAAGLPSNDVWATVAGKVARGLNLKPGARCPASLVGVGPAFPAHPWMASADASPPDAPVLRPLACPLLDRPDVRVAALVSTSTAVVAPMLRAAERAEALLRAGAYVHWYERFGVTADHIAVATDHVLNAVDAYLGFG
jgi:hypothetical protein